MKFILKENQRDNRVSCTSHTWQRRQKYTKTQTCAIYRSQYILLLCPPPQFCLCPPIAAYAYIISFYIWLLIGIYCGECWYKDPINLFGLIKIIFTTIDDIYFMITPIVVSK